MSDINVIAISGRVVADPELKQVGESQVCNFRFASNRSWKDPQGNYVDQPTFVTVNVWGPLGVICAQKIRKADQLSLSGRLHYSSWETDQGEKRNALSINADQVAGEAMFRPREPGDQFVPLPAVDDPTAPPTAPRTQNGDQQPAKPSQPAYDDIPF